MLNVQWVTSMNGNWLDLATVGLTNIKAEGVYVIWRVGHPSKVVRIGQGAISDRLTAHRNDPSIMRYIPLRVTWAVVPVTHRNGVERFLADQYQPLIGDALPQIRPIEVNLVA